MKIDHFDFIDAARGYAVLGVIVVHVAGVVPPTDGASLRLFEQGARGVQLFYVVSAATLLFSWYARRDGFLPFAIRRIFRITPLFWVAVPVYLSFGGMGSGYAGPRSDWDGGDVIRQLFYFDSILPSASSIVPGGWTVNTEMLFYLFFPLLAFLIRNLYMALLFYAGSLLLAVKVGPIFNALIVQSFPDIPHDMLGVWLAISLPSQLPVFLSGFVVFFALREGWLSSDKFQVVVLVILLFSIFLLVWFSYYFPITYGFWGLPLGLFVFCLGRGVGGLVSRPISFLGRLSFGAYLWHFLVINLVLLDRDFGLNVFRIEDGPSVARFFALLMFVVLFTLMIAFVSYRYIERPMIKVGRNVAERWRAKEFT